MTARMIARRCDSIVVDCRSTYVAIGTLLSVGVDYLELGDADMHDLRDTDTTRAALDLP